MNAKQLNSLLEKYYSGESTEEEESALREYFSGDNIPEGFEAEKEIFSFYKSEADIPGPSFNFGEKIMAGIDASEDRGFTMNYRRYLMPMLGAAASILILAGSYFFLSQNNKLQDTYSDPKIAYAETMRILYGVSSKMNKATMELEPVGKLNQMTTKSFKTLNKSTGIIEKNLKSLDYLKDAPDAANVTENK